MAIWPYNWSTRVTISSHSPPKRKLLSYLHLLLYTLPLIWHFHVDPSRGYHLWRQQKPGMYSPSAPCNSLHVPSGFGAQVSFTTRVEFIEVYFGNFTHTRACIQNLLWYNFSISGLEFSLRPGLQGYRLLQLLRDHRSHLFDPKIRIRGNFFQSYNPKSSQNHNSF